MTSETESKNVDQWNQAIDRCAAAYQTAIVKMPKDPNPWVREEIQQKAYLAFAAELPILRDPFSIHLYVACISKGASIGAIDIADMGRFCHIANTALSVWKLANLTLPAAEAKEREAEEKAQQRAQARVATPLPPKGNQSGGQTTQSGPEQSRIGESMAKPLPSKGNLPDEAAVQKALQNALDHLPRFEEQKKYFRELRSRGMLLPCDAELRDNPLAALHFVRMADEILTNEARAEYATTPQPTKEQPKPEQEQPTQAA